jgi:hypothetical protein
MATPRAPYTRNSYDGGATQASLSAAIDASTTTITLANTSNSWDSLGASYGFFMSLDYGGQYEEKVYVPNQSITWTSTTVTLINVVRGVDGTTPQSHVAAAVVVVVMTATDLDEANYAVTQTVGKVTTQGDMLYASSANALARLAPGTAGQLLQTNGSGAAPTWVDYASLLTGVSDLFIATPTTGTTAPSVSVSGFTKYVVVAWRALVAAGAGDYGMYVNFGATANVNGVINTMVASAKTSQVTFYFVEGVPTTSTTVSVGFSGTSAAAGSANYLAVIGLHS